MAKRAIEKRSRCFENLEDRLCMAVASAGWDGPGKGTANLTYFLANTPAGLSKADVSAAIKTALDTWSQVAAVRFTESKTPGQAKQLDISFGKIDGAGGILAQAYFPADVNPSRIAGDVQFDSSENWEIGNARGPSAFDLVQIAVHEFGHALGLDHSNMTSAILAPSVSANEYFTALDRDDVDAILSIYAPASGSSTQLNPGLNSNQPSKPPISLTPVPTPTPNQPATPNQPTTPSRKPLDPFTDWNVIEFRTNLLRWSSNFSEFFRIASRWRLFG